VDEHSIARIRNANFSHSVRGYDRSEVDQFLDQLADWLQTSGGEELERIGEQTAAILVEAHDAAQVIREDAQREVRQQLVDANATAESVQASAAEDSEREREEADAYARKTRADADSYSERIHAEVETEFGEKREAAEREAERIVGDANRRKSDIEAVISDLEQRRDAVLAELEKLASGIAGAATQHRTPQGDADQKAGRKAKGTEADEAETAVVAQDSD
jgi:DivIVA domain-containing protein